VARRLTARGHAVVVTGSASERALAAHIAALAGLPPSAVLAGDTGLLELAALVSSARLVVSGDTGAAHLATAFATPSVTLFGPIAPSRWGPPDGPHVALWHGRDGDATGNPWGKRIDPRLLDISADEVLDACARLLDFTGRRRSA
jgi:ADP-heptose:LPS heptosyltransferase